MGLYAIQIKQGMAATIPETMQSLGLPVIRTEQRDERTLYFYADPASKKEHSFWTYSDGARVFWCCGLSRSGRHIAAGFSDAGLFVPSTLPA